MKRTIEYDDGRPPLPIGQCPYCDQEHGRQGGWGFSPEGWEAARRAHNAGHPTFGTNAGNMPAPLPLWARNHNRYE